MNILVLVVDDEKNQADNIASSIAQYPFILNRLCNKKLNFTVETITGRNAYQLAIDELSKGHSYHIIFSDEQLHANSGFELLESIDTNIYSTYKILFSKHDERASKVNENKSIKWVSSKRIINVFQVLILFEKEVLFEKLFGKIEYFNTVYKCTKDDSAQNPIFLNDILDVYNNVKLSLSQTNYAEVYEEERFVKHFYTVVNAITTIQIRIKGKYSSPIIKTNKNNSKIVNAGSLRTLPFYDFVLSSTMSTTGKYDNSIYFINDNEIDLDEVNRIHSSIRKSLGEIEEELVITNKSYTLNLLWVKPLTLDDSVVEVIHRSNTRLYLPIPRLQLISTTIERLRHYFK